MILKGCEMDPSPLPTLRRGVHRCRNDTFFTSSQFHCRWLTPSSLRDLFIHSFSPQRLTKFLPSGHPYTAENNFLHSWGLEVPDPVKHSYGYWKVHLGLCVIELGLLCCSASLTDWPWASQVNVQMSVSSSIKYRHCLPISASPADFSAWMWDLWIQIQGLRHLWHVLLG